MNSANSFLPLTSPHVLLSLPTTHILRVSSHLSRRGLEVVFTEKLRTGHEVKMLVGSPVLTPEAIVSEILAHGPLARILSRPPLVVSASTRGFADVASCFAEACTASQSAGRALKVVGSSKLRAQLLSSPTPGCSPTGEDTFVLDALYGDALYLYGARSSAQSPPPTSPPTFAPRSSEVCKAVYKIEEAFSSRSWGASLETANCLDVGASPGSWTSFLAEKTTGTVLAVDPGDLKPEVLSLPNVSHLRVLASPSTVEELRSSLPEKWAAGVIVCDINKPPTVAIEACDALTPLLSEGAMLVLTLKLSCGKSVAGRAAQEKAALEALEAFGGWVDIECRWLFGNTANESTITAVWNGRRTDVVT